MKLVALVFILFAVQAFASQCSYTAADGTLYDFSPLENNAPYSFTDDDQNTYYVDFCQDTAVGCDSASTICIQTPSGQFVSLGSPNAMLFDQLPSDQGVEITYGTNESCGTGNRKTTVIFGCSPDLLTLDSIKKPDECYTIISLFSSFGCPANMNITDDETAFCGQFVSKDECFGESNCKCGWCDEQCVSTKYQNYCSSYEFECAAVSRVGFAFLLTASILAFMLCGFACCLCCCYKSRRAAHYRQIAASAAEQESALTDYEQQIQQAIELSKAEVASKEMQTMAAAPAAPEESPVFVYQPMVPQFVSPLQYAQYAHFPQFAQTGQQPLPYPFFFQPQVQVPENNDQ